MANIVKSKELAEILAITTRRVNQLVKEGVLEKDGKGCFDLTRAVPAYITYATLENDELRQEKTLHERAKRQAAELKLGKLRNQLHDADDVKRVMTHMLITFRNRILGIPSKTAPLLIGRSSIGEIQQVLNKEVYDALTELADYDPMMFAEEIKSM